MKQTSVQDNLPWYAKLILLKPRTIATNLERIRQANIAARVPNRWQIFLGVARMIHRLIYKSGPVGTSLTTPVRANWRARLWQYRPLRFPFLLWEGSVVPLDLSGLASSPETVTRHLLGTYHNNDGAFYDLRLLSVHPGCLEDLRQRCLDVIEKDDRRSRWLRDLSVYEGYHELLLAAVDRALADDWYVDPNLDGSDAGLVEYLAWCASRPDNPKDSWQAWRQGTLGLGDKAPAVATTNNVESL